MSQNNTKDDLLDLESYRYGSVWIEYLDFFMKYITLATITFYFSVLL